MGRFQEVPLSALAEPPAVDPDLHVYDVTLRDGEQAPGVDFSIDDAAAIARAVDDFGAAYVEAGYPARDDRDRLAAVRDALDDATAVGLAAAHEADVDAVLAADLRAVSLFAGGSEIHSSESVPELADRVGETVEYAVAHGLEVRFAVTDVGRTEPAVLEALCAEAAGAGASMLGLTDTVGILTPRLVGSAVEAVADEHGLPVSVHLHDDLGSSVGNAVAAAEAGARQVHTTVDGLGPSAGNTALAPFAVAMAVHHDLEVGDLSALGPVTDLVAELGGVEPCRSAPVTGPNVFTYTEPHRAERSRADPRTYEAFPPDLVGRERRYSME